jgi:hypothetical protein
MNNICYVWNYQTNSEQRWLRLWTFSSETTIKIIDFTNTKHGEYLIEQLRQRGRQVTWMPIS